MAPSIAQIKKIHALKNQIGMNDDVYRGLLYGHAKVDSSKKLNFRQAAQVIEIMERSIPKKQPVKKAMVLKYNNLANRDGMASPKQLRKIEAMWADVSFQPDQGARAMALRKFLQRIVGVADITWLEAHHVQPVIKALEVMKNNNERKAI